MTQVSKIPQTIEALRHEGVRGEVCVLDFDRKTVFSAPGCIVEIRIGKLEEGAYDYGYYVYVTADGASRHGCDKAKNLEKIPGEGSSWFASASDAELYVLHSLKGDFDRLSDVRSAIDSQILSLIHSASLFD